MPFTLNDFPILRKKTAGKRLIYLDSAATSLKPQKIIDAVDSYYREYSANVHRGIYEISERASREYEKARAKVARFVGAKTQEIVFVRNTTEAINLVAYSWGDANVGKADRIITSIMEHHSNFVPWQELALRKKAEIKYLDITDDGQLKLDQLDKLLTSKTKLVAISHISNVLGTINPVEKICNMAHKVGALVLVDGAQAVPHRCVDVKRIGCDFYAFSGHKMLGPTGIGVLWVKEELAKNLKPHFFGGGMIGEVSIQRTSFDDFPRSFEAGTPHIAGAIGLGAAVSYLEEIGLRTVVRHEQMLTKYTLEELNKLKGIKVYGPASFTERSGIVSFTLDEIHPHDLATILDGDGIAIRAGHHCCMPLHKRLGINATARASFYIYNNKEDIDKLIEGLNKARKILV